MGSLLTAASVQNLAVLLDLYPVTCLREHWQGIEGAKDELCLAIAGRRNLPEIFAFAHQNFGICKQNIYILKNESGFEAAFRLDIPGFEQSHESAEDNWVSKTFLVRHEVDIILRDPLDEVTVDFILPVRFDFNDNYVLIRFVKFERDFHALFKGRRPVLPRQAEKEKAYLSIINKAALDAGLRFAQADLHKGVKALWGSGFMDSAKIKFKTADSTDSKFMDDNKGLRRHNPDEYGKIKDTKLHLTLFETNGSDDAPPVILTVDPTKGFVSFGRYTERVGDSDYVVHEILRHNE